MNSGWIVVSGYVSYRCIVADSGLVCWIVGRSAIFLGGCAEFVWAICLYGPPAKYFGGVIASYNLGLSTTC